jgi:iron complex outermembrane receptor protein
VGAGISGLEGVKASDFGHEALRVRQFRERFWRQPSLVSANYRLMSNWSIYGDFGKGDEIPPSSLFDVAGGGPEVGDVGSPMMTTAYQGGTVVKLNRLTFDADYYAVKFQNNYISYTTANPNNPAYNLNEYYLGPDSLTQGFEAEANASLTHGLNLYANGTVGKATYTGTGVPSGLNVSDTPAYTPGPGTHLPESGTRSRHHRETHRHVLRWQRCLLDSDRCFRPHYRPAV